MEVDSLEKKLKLSDQRIFERYSENKKMISIFERIKENKKMTKVHLNLPKFQVESEISLVKPLKALGIEKLFRRSADLRGITDREISPCGWSRCSGWSSDVDAIQKAVVKVDEAGIQAAVAEDLSSAGFSRKDRGPISFEANHPFLFFVRDLQTGLLLLQGRVVKPNEFPDDHIFPNEIP